MNKRAVHTKNTCTPKNNVLRHYKIQTIATVYVASILYLLRYKNKNSYNSIEEHSLKVIMIISEWTIPYSSNKNKCLVAEDVILEYIVSVDILFILLKE